MVKYQIFALLFIAIVAQAGERHQPAVVWDQENNRLTISIKNKSFVDVIQEISKKTGIQFELNIKNDMSVSVAFHRLPLEKGLKRLVRPHNMLIYYGKDSNGSTFSNIERIVILERNDISDQPDRFNYDGNLHAEYEVTNRGDVPEKPVISLDQYVKNLESKDSQSRINTVIDMVEDFADESFIYLENVISNDDDPEVRSVVAEVIGDLETEAGIIVLMKGLKDQDQYVRESVITALSYIGTPAVLPALRIALQDPNIKIRQEAESLIREISEDLVEQ